MLAAYPTMMCDETPFLDAHGHCAHSATPVAKDVFEYAVNGV